MEDGHDISAYTKTISSVYPSKSGSLPLQPECYVDVTICDGKLFYICTIHDWILLGSLDDWGNRGDELLTTEEYKLALIMGEQITNSVHDDIDDPNWEDDETG